MRIELYCNSGTNIHSKRTEVIDTVEDWSLDEGEWESMSEEDQDEMVMDWANERLDIGWKPA